MKILALLSKHGVRSALSIAILMIMLLNTVGKVELSFINQLENFAYDTRLKMFTANTVDDRIVIIDIDEKSLKEQGRWPWGRNKLADLVNKLFDAYHVNVLGFDVVFAEKDESSGLKNLEEINTKYLLDEPAFSRTLEKLRPTLDYDQVFANSLKGRNVVLGYFFSHDDKPMVSGTLPQASFLANTIENENSWFIEDNGFGANLEVLQKSAVTAGHINPVSDEDGISRRVPMLIKYDGKLYEALSVAVARVALGMPKLEVGYSSNAEADQRNAVLEWLQIGSKRVSVDEQASALIPYRGRQGSFTYVSATDVLNGKVAPAVLENKIVLLGTTAAGLMDLRATPVQNVYPGVEIHANLIAGILDNNIKEHPAYTLGAEFLMLLLVGLLLAFMLPALNPLWVTIYTVVISALVILLNLAAWQYANLVLPLAALLVMIVLIYTMNMSYGFFVESRGKRQLAGLFGQYVPPELVDEMARNPQAFSLEGESREMTVMFSDVRGFTTISEGLDPKELSCLINEFLTPMTHVIHHNRGTIDKYMGDAIMAFWGAPMLDGEHARKALRAAMEMMTALEKLNQLFTAKGWPAINIGIGLNSDVMTVGNMGSEFRMAYTVMGDGVNLASRLESLTKNYGVNIIVSEFTKALVPEFAYRELDIVRVKGKDRPVVIFEPICEEAQMGQATKDSLKLYSEALKLYRSQNWDLAEMQFMSLQRQDPQRYVYDMYTKRIAYFRQTPPEANWDGVFNYETK